MVGKAHEASLLPEDKIVEGASISVVELPILSQVNLLTKPGLCGTVSLVCCCPLYLELIETDFASQHRKSKPANKVIRKEAPRGLPTNPSAPLCLHHSTKIGSLPSTCMGSQVEEFICVTFYPLAVEFSG